MPKSEKQPLDKPEIAETQEVTGGSQTMDALTAAEEFPRPDEEAIAAITNKEATKAPKSKGEEFDAKIHRVGDDGKPALTKTGKFRKKTGYKFINPETAKPAAPSIGGVEMTSKNAAVLTSSIIERLSVALVSDEFEYSELERAANWKAWEDCYDFYGGVNLSPPMALAADHLTIIMTRINKPKTISKISMLIFWAKNKFKRKNKNGALPDSGNDGSRKDNVGTEKSA